MDKTLSSINDFSDRLSPMLVKELRQGLRTRVFVYAFVVLQVALILPLFFVSFSGDVTQAVTSIMWACLYVVFAVLAPLQGIAALGNEIKMNTLSLIQVTRLSSQKIVWGKWVAIVAQLALATIAVLPYIFLRYFVSGINIFHELYWLSVLFLYACLLTAVTVSFSVHQNMFIRSVLTLGILFPNLSFSVGLGFSFRRGGLPSIDLPYMWAISLGVIVLVFLAIYYLLSMGASFIAPASENHATKKRLLGVVIFVFSLSFFMLMGYEEFGIVLSLFLFSLFTFDSLSESPEYVSRIYVPFVGRGLWGKLMGFFLYPGWQSGILYTAALFMGGVAIVCFAELMTVSWNIQEFLKSVRVDLDEDFLAVFFSLYGALLFPCLITSLFFRKRHKHHFLHHLVIHIICFWIGVFLLIMAQSVAKEIFWIGAFIPHVCLFNVDKHEHMIMYVSGIVTCIYFGILLILTLPIFRKIRSLERGVSEEMREKDKLER